jgi:hypothetical protein
MAHDNLMQTNERLKPLEQEACAAREPHETGRKRPRPSLV